MKTEKTILYTPIPNEQILARARYCETAAAKGYHVGGSPVYCQGSCGRLILVESLLDYERYANKEFLCTECKEAKFKELPVETQKKLENANRALFDRLAACRELRDFDKLISDIDQIIAKRKQKELFNK